MVLIDASMLLLFMQPGARGPTDASGNPVAESRKRVEYVISELDRTRTKIAIPTPALSESLIRMVPQEAQRIVEMLNPEGRVQHRIVRSTRSDRTGGYVEG